MSDMMADIGDAIGAEIFGDDFVPSEAPAEPDTPALAVDANDRLRDDQGRFASAAEPAEETPESTEPAVSEPETTETEPEAASDDTEAAVSDESGEIEIEIDDEEVLAYLEKYEGDVVAALKAATNAQKVIGKQGQELGEFRNAFEEALDERLAAMQREIISKSINWGEQISENPKRAAELAVETGNGQALVAALQAWEEEDGDPAGPQMFLRMAQAELALQEQQAAPAEPDDSFDDVMTAFKAKHPDVTQFLPTIQEIVKERPTLARALSEGSSQERATALEDALLLARSQRQTADTSAAARRVILRAKQEADAAKAEAVVESASNTSAATAGPSESEALQSDLRTLTGLDDLVVV